MIFIVCIAAGINYSGLADHGTKFTLMLIAAGLLVGFNEEGMFRVIGVTRIPSTRLHRRQGGVVVSLIFGPAHISNSSVATRAPSPKPPLCPSLATSSTSFGACSALQRAEHDPSRRLRLHDHLRHPDHPEGEDIHALGASLAILVYLACGVLVLIRRHKIEPHGQHRPPSPSRQNCQ